MNPFSIKRHSINSMASVLLLIAIAGCSNTPTSEQVLKDATESAPSNVRNSELFKFENIHKTNGWANGADYTVEYGFDIIALKSYKQLFEEELDNSFDKALKYGNAGERFSNDFMTDPELRGTLRVCDSANFALRKLASTNDSREKAYDDLIEKYKPLLVEKIKNHNIMPANGKSNEWFSCFTAYWILESYEKTNALYTTEDTEIGTKIERAAHMTYKKTENGWIKVSD